MDPSGYVIMALHDPVEFYAGPTDFTKYPHQLYWDVENAAFFSNRRQAIKIASQLADVYKVQMKVLPAVMRPSGSVEILSDVGGT